MKSDPPCLVYEDDHLLVINKPAGINTHQPAPHSGEGIYEWLKHRERRWERISILQRLDRETSGVMVFGKTDLANQSLTRQFSERTVGKKYLLLTDRPLEFSERAIESAIVRSGARYQSRPLHAGSARAVTRFVVAERAGETTRIVAEPLTGRTHQIRVQAAANGFPILGDALYGGTTSSRLFLHAFELTLQHPATKETVHFIVEDDFKLDPARALRERLISGSETNCLRLIHGAADGHTGWYLDQFGDYLLSEAGSRPSAGQLKKAETLVAPVEIKGIYHKAVQARTGAQSKVSPELLDGVAAQEEIEVKENGVRFLIRFNEGGSVGLFLDQRDNRRRLLTGYPGPGFPAPWSREDASSDSPAILNAFAYTCGFSVCGALAGAQVVSIDLSRKYLEWGKRNFVLNGIDPAKHEFLAGDVFDWFRRLQKQRRLFAAVLLDPPTFSRSKTGGVFQVEKDYTRLAAAASALVQPGGLLFASSNAATLSEERFLEMIGQGVGKRRILKRQFHPQPPDFPITRDEPAHLKSVWLQLE